MADFQRHRGYLISIQPPKFNFRHHFWWDERSISFSCDLVPIPTSWLFPAPAETHASGGNVRRIKPQWRNYNDPFKRRLSGVIKFAKLLAIKIHASADLLLNNPSLALKYALIAVCVQRPTSLHDNLE